LNISTGQGVSISEVINQLRDLGSIDIKLRQADAPEGLKLKSVLSCKKLEEIITWKPRRLNESLLNLIQNSG
jgi:UDP-glucose 4-epimerase